MKRYRVFSFDLDSTGDLLNDEIREEWDDEIKEQHRQSRERMIEDLTRQYGEWAIDGKIENLRTIGGQALSIVAYHNDFYRQARTAFIVGAYYPALTAACALGERILNHLILELRDEYRDAPGYARFANKESSDDWYSMTKTLESWGVLVEGVGSQFRALARLRNRAIHFDPALPEQDREMAIAALKQLDEIISAQFGAFGPHPWFIPVAGVALIRKEWEENPFVKLVYLPKCGHVGPDHRVTELDLINGIFRVQDREDYEEREITDEEYVQLYEAATKLQAEAPPEP